LKLSLAVGIVAYIIAVIYYNVQPILEAKKEKKKQEEMKNNLANPTKVKSTVELPSKSKENKK
jgi:mannose/fructose/N-acetylgalactosamine-specific phosphotransferase system component IIC